RLSHPARRRTPRFVDRKKLVVTESSLIQSCSTARTTQAAVPATAEVTSLHSHRLWLTVGSAAAATALALTAGCSSSAATAGSSAPAESAGSAGASGQPSAGQSSPADGPQTSPVPVRSARQAAKAIQGPAAMPTTAQLAALTEQSAEIAKLSPAQMAGQRV